MPLKITQKPEGDVPRPTASGRVNEDLVAIRNEMSKLASGMVLEIEAGSQKAVRSAKTLVTRASRELGSPWIVGRIVRLDVQDGRAIPDRRFRLSSSPAGQEQ